MERLEKLYDQLKRLGICAQCKRSKALKNRVKCGPCLYDDREYRRAKREIKKNDGVNTSLS